MEKTKGPGTTITRKEYLADSSLYGRYYGQFVTEGTLRYVMSGLRLQDIKKALLEGDVNLATVRLPFDHRTRGGGCWWDLAPLDTVLLGECGETDVPSVRTCTAKEAARMLVGKGGTGNAQCRTALG